MLLATRWKRRIVIVGCKGSYGKVSFYERSVFCIDTAYLIDQHNTSSDLRWLFYVLQALALDAMSQDTGVPGLSREDPTNSDARCLQSRSSAR
jgi:hypothetical protein